MLLGARRRARTPRRRAGSRCGRRTRRSSACGRRPRGTRGARRRSTTGSWLVEPERVQPAADHGSEAVGDGRVAPAAVADDLGRDALADRALGGRVREDREVAVAVRVDEPGADDLAGRVDHAVCGRERHRAGRRRRSCRPRSRRRRGTAGCPLRRRPSRSGSGRRARRRYFLARDVADVRAEPGIEDVAQAVAEEVEAQHRRS